jgi:flagellar assembly protein FliH
MSRPARFTFDLDLAQGPRPAAPMPVGLPEELVARLIEEARAEGFAEGRKEGERAASVMAAQAIAAAAAGLAARSAEMTEALDGARQSILADAAALAASIGRKLAGHLIARQPTAELEALIVECLASLDKAPHLVIRCHPDLADAVRDIATEHMAHSSFSGRLVVLGDPDQRLGDGRLEWVDGGLVRDVGALSAEIDRNISDFLAARRGLEEASA